MLMSVVSLLAAAVVSFPLVAQHQNTEPRLRGEIKRHYTAFSLGRYDLMWKSSSKRFKDSNDNDKAEYIRELQKYGFGRTKVKILTLQISDDSAEATIRFTIWSNHEKRWLRTVTKERWLFEEGRWVFDGQLQSISVLSKDLSIKFGSVLEMEPR